MTRITEEGSWGDYLLAGFCVALASLHKIYMLLLGLPFLGAHLWRALPRARSGSPGRAILTASSGSPGSSA